MNRIKGLVAISVFSLLILGLPAIASAQWGGNGGYGNGGYGNGGYNNRYYNMKSTIRNLKNKAERFEDAVDRYDDNNGRYNRGGWGNGGYGGYGNGRYGGYGNGGYGNVGDLERLADQFKKAADKLEDAFGNGRNLDNSEDEARRVLDLASEIDQRIYNLRGRGNIQGQWNSMRQELDSIADLYGYNGYNNYPNRNNRRNRNGNWRNNIPFPLPF